ncbi:hypothetical protein GCM10027261_24740 [Geodermatophilus arenarius]
MGVPPAAGRRPPQSAAEVERGRPPALAERVLASPSAVGLDDPDGRAWMDDLAAAIPLDDGIPRTVAADSPAERALSSAHLTVVRCRPLKVEWDDRPRPPTDRPP